LGAVLAGARQKPGAQGSHAACEVKPKPPVP